MSNRACNLLPKDMLRAALADEIKEHGPEVALVGLGESFSCGAEWLTGARACPHRSVCGPSCELQGEAPSSDASEEMTLAIPAQVPWGDFGDRSLIDNTVRDESASDEFSQPSG